MTIYQRLEFLWVLWFAREHDKWWGVVFLRTNWLAMFKAWEPKAKLLRSSWNWNLVKPNLYNLAFHCAKSAEQHWLLVGATANLLIGPKGILLLSHWPCIRISYYSLSLATRHPVQCRPNMTAGCAIVWVCKCLPLIQLSALHLTLFDIYV